ncbi:hypothetical protein [Flexithrix dorotheae]|uniref:hypothetical protein n=1 Tax=Flexithrix dorotheae TaxID=70993 RepID=UPI00036DF772|nr:hypothetical protein [Flexithrix dorotheae]
MKSVLLVPLVVFINLHLTGQSLPQHVDFQELGFSFDIPDGWTGQIDGDYVLLGHHTIPGIMILFQNDSKDAASLKRRAMQGIYEEGVSLSSEGDFNLIGENRVEGIYTGNFHGTNARCFAIGLINGLGSGLSIILVTEPDKFNDRHIQEAKKLAESVKFYQVKESEITLQWKNKIVGKQLKYMYTNSSNDYTGGYSGVSEITTIDLCPNGNFSYYSNTHSSFSSGNSNAEAGSVNAQSGFGYGNSNTNNQGTYQITSGQNITYLILNFSNGNTLEYQLSQSDDGKTYLDETRYFIIESENCY